MFKSSLKRQYSKSEGESPDDSQKIVTKRYSIL